MAHFYLSDELETAAVGDRVAIGGAEARHAVTVSRLAVGETVAIGNGSGLVVSGPVVTAEHTELAITVESVEERPRRTPAVFLAQALAKNDRDELAVQAVDQENSALEQEINNLKTELELRRELANNSPMAIIQRHGARAAAVKRLHGPGEVGAVGHAATQGLEGGVVHAHQQQRHRAQGVGDGEHHRDALPHDRGRRPDARAGRRAAHPARPLPRPGRGPGRARSRPARPP